MLYACDRCGRFRPDMTIDPGNDLVICSECGRARSFRRVPLYAVGGASGTDKTAVCKAPAGKMDGEEIVAVLKR